MNEHNNNVSSNKVEEVVNNYKLDIHDLEDWYLNTAASDEAISDEEFEALQSEINLSGAITEHQERGYWYHRAGGHRRFVYLWQNNVYYSYEEARQAMSDSEWPDGYDVTRENAITLATLFEHAYIQHDFDEVKAKLTDKRLDGIYEVKRIVARTRGWNQGCLFDTEDETFADHWESD